MAYCQPNTEVYLFDLKVEDSLIFITNPVNISNNPGYDNQPSFLSDSRGILFSSARDGQTDIRKYDIVNNSSTWLTETEGSEYSPTQMPDQQNISSIVLEKDGRQLLWSYPLSGGNGTELIPYLKIGYHVWFSTDHLFAYVLGPQSMLQSIDLNRKTAEIITQNIGRSLHKIPGTGEISYIDKSDTEWKITTYNPSSGESQGLVSTPDGSEDMIWLNDGSVLIGDNSKIMRWHTKWSPQWQMIRDLSESGKSGITRLAVSPDHKKLAVVVTE